MKKEVFLYENRNTSFFWRQSPDARIGCGEEKSFGYKVGFHIMVCFKL